MTAGSTLSAPPLPRINVGISSPGDVAKERAAAMRVLMRWNAQHHHGAMLNALGWEWASVPALGDHPQNILNEDIIRRCQLLVAIFWSTLGTPTPNAPSGTVDEINEFIRLKGPKRVMLYFCVRPVPAALRDFAEQARLAEYKAQMHSRGLYCKYRSVAEFERILYQHLDAKVADYLARRLPPPRSGANYRRAVAALADLRTEGVVLRNRHVQSVADVQAFNADYAAFERKALAAMRGAATRTNISWFQDLHEWTAPRVDGFNDEHRLMRAILDEKLRRMHTIAEQIEARMDRRGNRRADG